MKIKIIDSDLCLTDDSENKIIKRHTPFTKIEEFKQVAIDCIIIRENTNNYNTDKSNIYCLNDNLNVIWFSDQPFQNDTFPNKIEWDKELNSNCTDWSDYIVDNPGTLTCSSSKGFTSTIEYKTGKILRSTFTK